MTLIDAIRQKMIEKGGPGSGWYAPPRGSHSAEAVPGGEGASIGRHKPAWETRASVWLDEGNVIPPELYDGLRSRRIETTIHVTRHKPDDYTVTHTMRGMRVKVPLATHARWEIAQDQALRIYGANLNEYPSDLIGSHRKLVAAALRRGDHVPAEIFQDYPDLKPG